MLGTDTLGNTKDDEHLQSRLTADIGRVQRGPCVQASTSKSTGWVCNFAFIKSRRQLA
jgi:hypothetical protein